MTALDTIIGNHPAGWDMVSLESICKITVGPSRLKKTDGVEDGVPVVSPAQILGGQIVLTGAFQIDHEAARGYSTHRLLPRDIVMTRKGIQRRHALASAEHEGAVVDGSCFRLRVRERVLAEYLHHYLTHRGVQEWFASRNRQGLIANLRSGELGSLPVLVPPLPEQHEMVNLFRLVDEKIEIHEQIIAATRQTRDRLIEPLLATGLGAVESLPAQAGRSVPSSRPVR